MNKHPARRKMECRQCVHKLLHLPTTNDDCGRFRCKATASQKHRNRKRDKKRNSKRDETAAFALPHCDCWELFCRSRQSASSHHHSRHTHQPDLPDSKSTVRPVRTSTPSCHRNSQGPWCGFRWTLQRSAHWRSIFLSIAFPSILRLSALNITVLSRQSMSCPCEVSELLAMTSKDQQNPYRWPYAHHKLDSRTYKYSKQLSIRPPHHRKWLGTLQRSLPERVVWTTALTASQCDTSVSLELLFFRTMLAFSKSRFVYGFEDAW